MQALIEAAMDRIRGHVATTPLIRSQWLSSNTGADVFLKLENLQWTGSFKLRGATNKLLSLSAEDCEKGIVTASTGNHGAAVAHAGTQLDIPTLIFVPASTSTAKLAAIEERGVQVRVVAGDALQSELAAKEYSKNNGLTYISPYNDPDVIAGQGTVGVEILDQLPSVDTVIASVGGGGLISGVGSYLKSKKPGCRILGASPKNSPAMQRSLLAGKIVDCEHLPTLSDGTAGGIEADSMTFSLCRELIEDFALVEESVIRTTLATTLHEHHIVIEGAAAVAIAAATQTNLRGRCVVVVLCGGNLSSELLVDLLKDKAAP